MINSTDGTLSMTDVNKELQNNSRVLDLRKQSSFGKRHSVLKRFDSIVFWCTQDSLDVRILIKKSSSSWLQSNSPYTIVTYGCFQIVDVSFSSSVIVISGQGTSSVLGDYCNIWFMEATIQREFLRETTENFHGNDTIRMARYFRAVDISFDSRVIVILV